MGKILRIAFVYNHAFPDTWMDGLWGALNEIGREHTVEKINLYGRDDVPEMPKGTDFVLGWGAFNSDVDRFVQFLPKNVKKGLCIAGNAFPPHGANNYDVLFYETKWYRPQIAFHDNIVQAFGVNTDIYSPPTMPVPIVWNYIGVGAFALWKRWDKMKGKQGKRIVIGEYQHNNEAESLGIVSDLVKNGVAISPMMSPFDLSLMYMYSRCAYIPADVMGGGERAVLEARACGCAVEIEPDNPKLQELVDLETVPSHTDYAKQLLKGIERVL